VTISPAVGSRHSFEFLCYYWVTGFNLQQPLLGVRVAEWLNAPRRFFNSSEFNQELPRR
jgi:hypothetical protein